VTGFISPPTTRTSKPNGRQSDRRIDIILANMERWRWNAAASGRRNRENMAVLRTLTGTIFTGSGPNGMREKINPN
jgi:hypothetical protein